MMFGLSIGTVFRILTGIAFAAVLAWGIRVDTLRAHWRDIAVGMAKEVSVILDKPVDPEDAAKAIKGIGGDLATERDLRRAQSLKITEMSEESQRLKAKSVEAWKVAKAAIKSRDAAIAKLNAQALTPGDRADCVAQLNNALEAIDAAYSAGL